MINMRKAIILSSSVMSAIVMLFVILIYSTSNRIPENFNKIKSLVNEWSQGPILRIKRIKPDPQDYENAYYHSREEKYNQLCTKELGSSSYPLQPSSRVYLQHLNKKSHLLTNSRKKGLLSDDSLSNENQNKINKKDLYAKTGVLTFDNFKTSMGCMCPSKNYLVSCSQVKDSEKIDTPSKQSGIAVAIVNGIAAILNGVRNANVDAECTEVSEIPKTPLLVWKGSVFCAERLRLSYLDFVLAEKGKNCPRGFKNCGTVDDFENNLCIPEKYDCPDTQFSRHFINNDSNGELKKNTRKRIGFGDNKNNHVENRKENKTNYLNQTENQFHVLNIKKDSKNYSNNTAYFNFKSDKKEKSNIDLNLKKTNRQYISLADNGGKQIYANFKIADKTPCLSSTSLSSDLSSDSYANDKIYFKLSNSDSEILNKINATNIKEFYTKNRLFTDILYFNSLILQKQKNQNISQTNGEYAYEPYFTLNCDVYSSCEAAQKYYSNPNNDDFKDNDKNNNSYDKIALKSQALDRISSKDLYYQNGLMERVVSLPKFPKQNLLFNATLFSQPYSGMPSSCRDLLLNLINFDNQNFIEFAKNIDLHYPKDNQSLFIVFIVFFIFMLEYYLVKAEFKYMNENNETEFFLAKNNVTNLKIFGLIKFFEFIFLVAVNLRIRDFSNQMVFTPTNNSGDINYEKLIAENKINHIENFDCELNPNFKVFSDIYSAYFTVSLYVTAITFVSGIMVVYPIIRLFNEFREEDNEHLNLADEV